MQSKVSMVMPCYNKVEYIGEMFDSIIAQKWDNIELILVNDGSTDGTREVIAEYEPRFIARGFEVVIIDQENAGVCAAAKAGLMRITGEFVCMVDADDELDPEYVSTMAGWLEGNGDCDFCVCDVVEYKGQGREKKFREFCTSGPAEKDSKHLERYVLLDIRSTIWVYMVRVLYLKKCHVVETYYTATKGSHEPGFIVPILAGRGKYKFFSLPLYHFNIGCDGHSRPDSLDKCLHYYEDYQSLCEIAIDRLSDTLANSNKRETLKRLAYIAKHKQILKYTYSPSDCGNMPESALVNRINEWFSPSPPIKHLTAIETLCLIYAVEDYILRRNNIEPNNLKGRIIAWGVLGIRGRRFLPLLHGTLLEPDELWDIAGDGVKVKQPNLSNLNSNDLVLVLPTNSALDTICILLEKTGCNIIKFDDIFNSASFFKYKFLQFYFHSNTGAVS